MVHAAKAAMAACLTLSMSSIAFPETKDIKDQIEQSQKASRAFSEIMDAADKGIPQNLLDRAKCVAVFPSVVKAGFIVGGRGGRGVASCRTATGWTSPAFFNLAGGSFGLQIGAESTDFVLLIMNDRGMNSLLTDQFTLGGDASVAAGPVGRQAGAETDARLNAEILSYSRSKGLFGGLELKGVVIKPDKDDIKEVYGANVTARDILSGTKVTAPPSDVSAFPTTLSRYSSAAKAAK
jgi:lipid-binding SYLF domain-containing protein